MKKKKWIKRRHKHIRNFFVLPVKIYCKKKYGVTVKKFKGNKKQNYLFLSNHQTDGDELFPYIAFRHPTYILATEDVFSNGWKSKIMEYAFAPIPIDKTSTDINAIKKCAKVAREGGSIVIFPEGNRTYSGEICHIKPSIIKLIRLLKIPVAFFNIEGGYGIQPRWADKPRKGKMTAGVKSVLSPEEYEKLSDEELYNLIIKELSVNEYEVLNKYTGKFKSEFLERAIYVCPFCGLSEWKSEGNFSTCVKCGAKIEYLDVKTIKGVNKEFPFSTIRDWYEYQTEYVSKIKLDELGDLPLYEERVDLYDVIPYKITKIKNKNAVISLYRDKITVNEEVFPYKNIQGIAVMGRNKLNIKINDKLYQIKGSKHFNALKYVNFYYLATKTEGDTNGKFLGL